MKFELCGPFTGRLQVCSCVLCVPSPKSSLNPCRLGELRLKSLGQWVLGCVCLNEIPLRLDLLSPWHQLCTIKIILMGFPCFLIGIILSLNEFLTKYGFLMIERFLEQGSREREDITILQTLFSVVAHVNCLLTDSGCQYWNLSYIINGNPVSVVSVKINIFSIYYSFTVKWKWFYISWIKEN